MSRSRSRRSIISLILSFVTLFISVESAGQCHAPDGSINADPAYQPCATDTSDPLHTICCATNRTQGADICVPNGLCQTGIKPGDPPKDPHYTKPQCTNANWDEPGCLHVCGNDNLQWIVPCDMANANSSRRWCCGFENDDCCNDGNHLEFEELAVNFGDALDPPSSASGSATSSPTVSFTLNTTPSSPTVGVSASDGGEVNAGKGNEGLSTGAKAGIGIGAAVGGLLLLGLGLYLGKFLYARKAAAEQVKAKELYADSGHGPVTYRSDGAYYGAPNSDLPVAYKSMNDPVDARATNVELASHRDPMELP